MPFVWYELDGNKRDNPLVDLPMEYNENHIGYVSAVSSLKNLIIYFRVRNLFRLFINGRFIQTFKTSNYVEYSGYYLIPINTYKKSQKNKRYGNNRTISKTFWKHALCNFRASQH